MKNMKIEPLRLNINLIRVNGKPALQFQKTYSLVDNNVDFIKKILTDAFNGKEIIAKIELKDKIRAYYKLKGIGLDFEITS